MYAWLINQLQLIIAGRMGFIPKMFLFLKISGHPVQGHSILQGSLISRKTKQHTADREKKDIQIFRGNLYGNRGFARQPCCMAGTKDSFSRGKRSSFICKIFSLFLPCNMAAVQSLYTVENRNLLSMTIYVAV